MRRDFLLYKISNFIWRFTFTLLFLQPFQRKGNGEVDEWLKSVVC